MKPSYRVIESSVSTEGKVSHKTHKGGLSQSKAQAMADRLNMAQDLTDPGLPILSYRIEVERGQERHVQQ